MYFLLPAVYLLVRKASIKQVFAIWFAVMFLSLAVCHYFPMTTLFSYAPCFMSGAVAYKLAGKAQWKLKATCWPLLLFSVAGMRLSFTKPTAYLQTLPVFVDWWILCAFIGFAIPFFGQLTMTAVTTTSKVVAKYSYSVYMSHLFCMWITLEKMHSFPLLVRMLAFVVLLVAVSVTLYHSVEHPFIKLGQQLTQQPSEDSGPYSVALRAQGMTVLRESDDSSASSMT
jgi:peptidoglycan/LPS O-acetylase OafA/YrhL